MGQFKFEASFKTWVLAIARNTFFDQARLASYAASHASLEAQDPGHDSSGQEAASHTEAQQMFAIDLQSALQVLSATGWRKFDLADCYDGVELAVPTHMGA